MNQETIKFCITSSNGEDVSVDIDGGAQDLTNLLATVISDNEEIEMVVTMALLAVHMSRNKAENGNNEDFLSELMMKMKPKAQA